MQKDQLVRDCEKLSADWLEALERVKREYRRYVEVAELYKLPRVREIIVFRYRPPSLEHPLTTNKLAEYG